MATLNIPEFSLVLMVGTSGSGKSTFARKHFKPTEVLSSDFFRGMVADDETNQAASGDAFDILHYVTAKRVAAGRLTVVDATNVQPQARKPLLDIARTYHCLPVAIVFDLPEQLCLERNRVRPDRDFGPNVVRRQARDLRRSLRNLRSEGFRYVHVLSSVDEVDTTTIVREPLWSNRTQDHGPFDIVGDVHGCFEELVALLEKLEYQVEGSDDRFIVRHPQGRKLVFVGDLVDRGPRIADALRLAMGVGQADAGYCVLGNHEAKLLRKLKGRNVQITHGLAETLAQLAPESPDFTERVAAFIDGLVNHYVFDDGRLVVAHAGLKEEMHGRASGAVQAFALYGETTGETDELGLPVRGNWAAAYRGKAMVVYGHTPVAQPDWLNRTINIDTGCVFGHRLTALRYPEEELVSVPAARVYYEPVRSIAPPAGTAPALSAQQQHDDLSIPPKRSATTLARA